MKSTATLDELQTFVLVVDAGSLAACARTLGLSTNAVSRRIMALEASLSAKLLARTTRALTLTPEGRVLYDHARRALEELDQARDKMRTTRSELYGSVRFAVPGGVCSVGVLRGIGALLEAHPDLDLDLQIVNAPADPVSGHFDVVLHTGSPPQRRVVARRLATVRWQLAAAPDYVARHGAPRLPDDLRHHRCLRIRSEQPQNHWHLVDRRGRTLTVPVAGSFQADDSRVLGDAIYAGIGIGVRPRSELADAVAKGQLIHVLPRYEFESVDLYALIAPATARMPRIVRLLDRLSEALQAVA